VIGVEAPGASVDASAGVDAEPAREASVADADADLSSDVGRPASRWTWSVACPDGHEPDDPLDYGRCAVEQALDEVGSDAHARVSIAAFGDHDAAAFPGDLAATLDARPESYVVASRGDATFVLGRDEVGAMYGALAVAERLRLRGAPALPLAGTLSGAPALAVRAANLFWTLPEDGERAWWFLDEGFWRAYLDLLAHARVDLLDLHGMYDPRTTAFPNAFLYLARSATLPDVGVPAADRERNLRMLNRVLAMARARGVRVALMTYLASSSVDGVAPEALSDAALATYDREAAADVATRAPGLAMIGFRIGETGKPAPWYIGSIVAGVRQAGTGVGIYTRSWLSRKQDILALASAAGPGLVLEAKLNGEHLGPPWIIAGGRMASWSSYSYQTYLEPPMPWRLVFQVRLGGTHRIFREASFERTRRALLAMRLSSDVQGFSLEPPHAFSPQRDFYHARAVDQLAPWTFVRDDLMYLLWGRLGYDPETPESLFRDLAAREAAGRDLWPLLQAAGDVVPWIQTGRTCGPDQRNFAPELELGGDVGQWAGIAGGPHSVISCDDASPFDTFAVASPADAAGDLLAGAATSRLSPRDVANRVLDDAARIDRELDALGPDALADEGDPLVRDVARESRALADLGRYFGHKLRGATALSVFARSGRAEWRGAARAETMAAVDAWNALAHDTSYVRPFSDKMRMQPLGFEPFHWSAVSPALLADAAALDAIEALVAKTPPTFTGELPDPTAWMTAPRAAGPGLAQLSLAHAPTSMPGPPGHGSLRARAVFPTPLPPDATVRILWKPFASEHDFVGVAATLAADGSWAADLPGAGPGALAAVEVRTRDGAWRYPDPFVETPYVALPP
jgi:hypothetical protein